MVLLVRRDLDPFDFLQLFDTALHLLGLGRLSTEPIDKGFQLLDAFLLVSVSGFELRAPLGFLRQVLLVVARVEITPACSIFRRSSSP